MSSVHHFEDLFKFNNLEVRTITKDGETWFVGRDVLFAMGAKDVNKALQRLPKKYLMVDKLSTSFGDKNTNFISESGVYRIAFRSKLPFSEKFSDWVTSEVLPSIRQNNFYIGDNLNKEEFALLKSQVNAMEPLVMFGAISERNNLPRTTFRRSTWVADPRSWKDDPRQPLLFKLQEGK